jgi:hypothetical protein
MAIRAIDYCPPVDLGFSDYLSALLTVDSELVPEDHHRYREILHRNFAAYGITKASKTGEDGTWLRCQGDFIYSRTHFDSMLRDKEEVFRFLWENRQALKIGDLGYLEVQSVRPSTRIGPDGFVLRETIAEYVQILTLTAKELRADFGIDVPAEIQEWRRLRVFGGGTLVFDEYGQLKYQIAKHLTKDGEDVRRQGERLRHLWETGFFDRPPAEAGIKISSMHLARSGLKENSR